jgi:hypothetical protein
VQDTSGELHPAAEAATVVVAPGALPGALAAALDGDRLVLLPGVHAGGAVDVRVELVGAEGRDATTILAGPGAPALEVRSGGVVVRGLTLSGDGVAQALVASGTDLVVEDAALVDGFGVDGGCAVSVGAAVTLRRVVVAGCTSTTRGGGWFLSGGTLEADAVTFDGSEAQNGFGGGLSVTYGSGTLRGPVFSGNVVRDPGGLAQYGYGGGLDVADASVMDVVGGVFSGNDAGSAGPEGGRGGGAFVFESSLSVTGSWFDGNTAAHEGAAVGVEGAGLLLAGSRVSGNLVSDPAMDPVGGGALSCREAPGCVVEGAWFERNEAGDGAAIHAEGPLAVSSTMFCANVARSEGGAVDVGNSVDPADLTGVVFAGNTAAIDGGALMLGANGARVAFATFVANSSPDGTAVGATITSGPVAAGPSLSYTVFAGQTGGGAAVDLDGLSTTLSQLWFFANDATDLDQPLLPATITVGVDPLLDAASDTECAGWRPLSSSPLLDVGPTGVVDADGSPADVGATGGPAPADGLDDADGDGFAATVDCDDGDAGIHVGAPERCDGADDDCDGLVDAEDDAVDAFWGHQDLDGDSFGDPLQVTWTCDVRGWTPDGTDCDDLDVGTNPGAFDVPGDGLDQDCDGVDAPLSEHTGHTGETGGETGATGHTGTVRHTGIVRHTGAVGHTGTVGHTGGHTGTVGPHSGGEPGHSGATDEPDSDADGLTDAEELALGSDPNDPDSDGDGVLDGAETAEGLLDAGSPEGGGPASPDLGFGCGCATGAGAGAWPAGLLLAALVRRRATAPLRRRPPPPGPRACGGPPPAP